MQHHRGPALEQYDVLLSGRDDRTSKGAIKEVNGRPIAYFQPASRLLNIRLSGPPVGPRVGPTVLTGERKYIRVIMAIWDESERQRFETQKIPAQQGIPAQDFGTEAVQPLFTSDEREWLKKRFGSELNSTARITEMRQGPSPEHLRTLWRASFQVWMVLIALALWTKAQD